MDTVSGHWTKINRRRNRILAEPESLSPKVRISSPSSPGGGETWWSGCIVRSEILNSTPPDPEPPSTYSLHGNPDLLHIKILGTKNFKKHRLENRAQEKHKGNTLSSTFRHLYFAHTRAAFPTPTPAPQIAQGVGSGGIRGPWSLVTMNQVELGCRR